MFSLLYYIFLLPLLTIFLIATAIAFPFVVLFDRPRRVIHEISRGIALLFLIVPPRWRTRVTGLENIERGQTYVIVLNHSAMTDIPMLYWLPLNFRWVSKSSIKMMPFIGQLMWFHGDILIPRDNPRKAIAKMMTDGRKWLIHRRVNVAIFPEGTRSKTGEMGKFKPTAFALAKEAGVAVLPVVLTGGRLIEKWGMMPWRHDFAVQVLSPVSAETVAAKEPKDIMDEVRNRMIEELRITNYELRITKECLR